MMEMKTRAEQLLYALEVAGYKAYFVGGCVRDELLAAESSMISAGRRGDIDITTNALPDEIKQVFSEWKVIDTGIKHGTVTVLMPCSENNYSEKPDLNTENTISIEITTYRSDGSYSDSRHPDEVHFVTSLKEDLQRRDFTINAIARDARGAIVDPLHGKQDIDKKIIRAVGDSDERFREDALRIMRALRFAAVLDFEIESETEKAIFANKELLLKVSAERIFAELKKLVTGKKAGAVLRRYVDALAVVIPELAAMKGFEQHNSYHRYDVLEHCIRALEAVETTPENEVYMKLAALLHDIGKPQTYSLDDKGIGHFYTHPHVGSLMAKELLQRLKADSFTIERVGTLIKYHDLVFEKDPRILKRWMNRFTPEILLEILAIKHADNLATGNMSKELEQKFEDIEQMLRQIITERQCFTLKDLAVKGGDIIKLGIAPGPEVGRMLALLLDAVIDGVVPNERKALEALVRSLS